MIEVLEGKLEMRAGKHWRQGGHAEVECVDPRWGIDSRKIIHGLICPKYPCEKEPGWDGEKRVKVDQGMNIFV